MFERAIDGDEVSKAHIAEAPQYKPQAVGEFTLIGKGDLTVGTSAGRSPTPGGVISALSNHLPGRPIDSSPSKRPGEQNPTWWMA